MTCHDPAPCDVFVSRVSQYPTPALPLCTRSDSLEEDAVVKAKEDKRRGVRHKGSPGGDNLVPSSHPPLHPTLRSVPFDNEGEWVHSRGGELKQPPSELHQGRPWVQFCDLCGYNASHKVHHSTRPSFMNSPLYVTFYFLFFSKRGHVSEWG